MSTADIPEYEEAISRFKKFLESESQPTELLWVFREDIYDKNHQCFVRFPPSETNQQLASILLVDAFPTDWSPDGQHILFTGEKRVGGKEEVGIWLYSFKDDKSSPLLVSPCEEEDTHYSPDGQWFAYSSDASGQTEVYIQSVPKLTQRRQVSHGGGSSPRWSPQSDELFYVTLDGTIMAIGFDRETGQLKTPAASLFKARTRFSNNRREFDVTYYGQTFFINEAIQDDANATLSLIINWTAKIKTK